MDENCTFSPVFFFGSQSDPGAADTVAEGSKQKSRQMSLRFENEAPKHILQSWNLDRRISQLPSPTCQTRNLLRASTSIVALTAPPLHFPCLVVLMPASLLQSFPCQFAVLTGCSQRRGTCPFHAVSGCRLYPVVRCFMARPFFSGSGFVGVWPLSL